MFSFLDSQENSFFPSHTSIYQHHLRAGLAGKPGRESQFLAQAALLLPFLEGLENDFTVQVTTTTSA